MFFEAAAAFLHITLSMVKVVNVWNLLTNTILTNSECEVSATTCWTDAERCSVRMERRWNTKSCVCVRGRIRVEGVASFLPLISSTPLITLTEGGHQWAGTRTDEARHSVCVCVFVFCSSVSVCVCFCVFVICVCLFIPVYVCLCVIMCICMSVCVCVHTCQDVCLCMCVCQWNARGMFSFVLHSGAITLKVTLLPHGVL